MDIITPYQYINALSSLTKKVMIKKYSIVQNETENVKSSDIENEINDSFKKDLGFGIKEINQNDQIIKYENRIDLEFSKISKHKILKYPVEDEIELVKYATRVSNDFLNNFNIEVDPSKRDFIKRLKFTVPQIVTLTKRAERIFVIPNKSNQKKNNILLISKTNYLKREYNVLIHLSKNKVKGKENFYSVIGFFLFQNSFSKNYNPIRLFLNTIFHYGINIKINNISKRFFLEETVLQKRLDGNRQMFEVEEKDKKSKFWISATMENKQLHTLIEFCYGFNETRYLKDFFDRKI